MSDAVERVSAAEMASMRMTAIALVHQWLAARDFGPVDSDARAMFWIRPHDMGLRPQVIDGRRIRVSITIEEEQ